MSRLRTALIRRLSGVPAPQHPIIEHLDLAVTMSDGTRLRTDLVLPQQYDERTPVFLVRNPYEPLGMRILGAYLAGQGLIVVSQSCRGTFGSAGEFVPFRDEISDGRDTIAWIRRQPWGEGPLMPVGVSYTGYTVFAGLASRPDGVMAVALGMTGSDFHRGVIYPQPGLFDLDTALTWIDGLVHQELGLIRRWLRMPRLRIRHRRALRAPAADADRVLLGEHYPPYQEWIAHDGENDPWWKPCELSETLDTMPPALLVAGWHDFFLRQQLADYRRLRSLGRRVRLVVGPWTHASHAETEFLRETLALAKDPEGRSGARIHIAGEERWVELESWPPPSEPHRLWLGAQLDLREAPPAEPVVAALRVDGFSSLPAAGGSSLNARNAGVRLQTERESADGVIVFTGEVLQHPLAVAGAATLEVSIETAGPRSAWMARVCDVDPGGRSRNVADGYAEVTDAAELRLAFSDTAHTFLPGHRVRLQLTPLTRPSRAPVPEVEPVAITGVRLGDSVLTLPVLPGGWADSGRETPLPASP
ncbi:MAG: CocE/NonD family hydrolase [Protaetiibacter sp.]